MKLCRPWSILCMFVGLGAAVPSPTNAPKERSLLVSRADSAPNPFKNQYPNNVTGTINSTLAVVPIPYKLARSLIPAKYGILRKSYMSLLPGFPDDKYPLVIRGAYDHDVGLFGLDFTIPDFQSIHIWYPFIDLLNDGYSTFNYNKYLIASADNAIVIGSIATDGTTPVPATFLPDEQTYAFTGKKNGEIYLNAYSNLSSVEPIATTKYTPLKNIGPWPVEFFKNVTNQPIFSDGSQCDNQLNIFNSTVSTGANVPVGIVGDIGIKAPYLPSDSYFQGVFGIKVDIAFVENTGQVCSSLKGYSGTGSGD